MHASSAFCRLRKRPDAIALRFNCHHGAVALAKHRVENSRRCYWTNSVSILKGYVDLNLSVVLELNAAFGAGIWDFVFCAISSQRLQELDASGPRCT